ncbi:hypothetical protein D3C72_66720 [compost metagenome]
MQLDVVRAGRNQRRRQLRQEQALAVWMVEVFMDFQRLRIITRQFGIVLMLVMTEMRIGGGVFMLTIGCGRCPGELERQSQQHQNYQQFFHGLNHNIVLFQSSNRQFHHSTKVSISDCTQQAHAVENHNQTGAHIGKDRHP